MRNKYATHIDFTKFKSLGTRTPSNLDMIFERKGQFLVGEWKRDNEKVSLGQQILLKQMARMPNFTVLIINGHSDNDELVVNKFWHIDGSGNMKLYKSSPAHLEKVITAWFAYADYR